MLETCWFAEAAAAATTTGDGTNGGRYTQSLKHGRAVRREAAEKRLLEGCVLQLQQEGTHLSAVPGQEGG